ncbi:unnamed protein product [Bursaphelenchus okinawaensis]|uniref:Uncharacterized protein n=1 Tax=Bursaphelenchus okinawaensis TaxID=465554 RepID=A0A811KGU3_9BILA|nr:unnamed protein product [Bursaphelenchus okinawaensis]CAG9102922.1 unnamed protein product [Bursaphelenchus okinawaensis]
MPVYVYFIDDGKVLEQSFVVALPDRPLNHAELVQEVRGQLDLSPRLHLLTTRYRIALNYFEKLKVPPSSINRNDELQMAFGLKLHDTCPSLPILCTPNIASPQAPASSLASLKKERTEHDDIVVVDDIPTTSSPALVKNSPPTLSNAAQAGDNRFNVTNQIVQRVHANDSNQVNALLNAFLHQLNEKPAERDFVGRERMKKSKRPSRNYTEEEVEAQEILKNYTLSNVINECQQAQFLKNCLSENVIDENFYVTLSNALALFIVTKTDKLWTPRTLMPVVEHYFQPYPQLDITHLFGPQSFRLRNKLNHIRMTRKGQTDREADVVSRTVSSPSSSPASAE